MVARNQRLILPDEKLFEYCSTDRQREIVAAVFEHGNFAAAGRVVGLSRQRTGEQFRSITARAAKAGYAPEAFKQGLAPDGYKVKGTSSYYRINPETGEKYLRSQWVKTDEDKERQIEIMQQVVEDIVEAVPSRGVVEPPKPEILADDLLSVYTISDAHMGMLAWGKETGEDWDIAIAKRVLEGCFAEMVRATPASKTAVVAQLGDFLHYDSMLPLTPTSGHILDADGRVGKMVSVALSVLEKMIHMALAKHETVYVLMAEGNHDMYGSIYLRALFARLFRDEPRIVMIHEEKPYYAMEFGQNMLVWHHGHKADMSKMVEIVPAMFPAMWGRTKYRVCHMGDKHHRRVREHAGITIEQHETLAANDAYAVRGGWMSHQRARAIVYHRQHGECASHVVTPAMIAPAQSLQ